MDFTAEELDYLLGCMRTDENEWTSDVREKWEPLHRALYSKIEAKLKEIEA